MVKTMKKVLSEISTQVTPYSFSQLNHYIENIKKEYSNVIKDDKYAELLLLLTATLQYASELDNDIYNFVKEYFFDSFYLRKDYVKRLMEKGVVKFGYVYDEGKPLLYSDNDTPRNLYYELFEITVFNVSFHVPVPRILSDWKLRSSILYIVLENMGFEEREIWNILRKVAEWDTIVNNKKEDKEKIVNAMKLMELMKHSLPSKSREEVFGSYFKDKDDEEIVYNRLVTDVFLMLDIIASEYYEYIDLLYSGTIYGVIYKFLEEYKFKWEPVYADAYIGKYTPVYDFITKPFFL